MACSLFVATVDGRGELLIPDADRSAIAFFQRDPSATGPRSYDHWVATAPRDRIMPDDLHAINATMNGRTAPARWRHLMGDAPWLSPLDPGWDLLRMSPADWDRCGCEARLAAVLKQVIGPYRGIPLATKLLHIKRPLLIPVCDSFVLDLLGVVPGEPARPEHVLRGLEAIRHFREQGRANLPTLEEIGTRLASVGIQRTLVRVFEALLWMSHRRAWSERKRWTTTVHYTG